jgi:hypothetical protein
LWILFSVAVAVSMVGPLLARGAPSARVGCRFDPATRVLSLALTGAPGRPAEARVRRVGDRIEVSGRRGESAVVCAGTPTVTEAERIEISTVSAAEIEFDLRGGPFAPGFGAEADGSPEIEVTLAGSGSVAVEGGPGADRFQYLTAAGLHGLNLNPGPEDRDVDVAFLDNAQNLLPIYAEGGPGPDTIETVGRSAFGIIADGEGDDDTLRASGAAVAVLDGGAGRDRILGSTGEDLIDPGPGPDTVSALGGRDFISLLPDRSRDAIGCGPGVDATGQPDRFDGLRACEGADGGRR